MFETDYGFLFFLPKRPAWTYNAAGVPQVPEVEKNRPASAAVQTSQRDFHPALFISRVIEAGWVSVLQSVHSLLLHANAELIPGTNYLPVFDHQFKQFFALDRTAGFVLERRHDLLGLHINDLAG